MKIYIPTLGRVHKQLTYDAISSQALKEYDVKLVCNGGEYRELKNLGYKVVICPEQGISKVRQWIVDQGEDDSVLMLDDDLKFYTRVPRDYHLKGLVDLEHMFARIDDALNDYVMVGIANRQSSYQSFPKRSIEIARLMCVLGFRTHILRQEHIRFDTLQIMEDFHATLSLLELGYPNLLLTDIAYNNSSNAQGGCSTYRTNDMHDRVSKQLHSLHPKFVKVVQKKTKWPNMPYRTDVIIQWRKAYEYGCQSDQEIL